MLGNPLLISKSMYPIIQNMYSDQSGIVAKQKQRYILRLKKTSKNSLIKEEIITNNNFELNNNDNTLYLNFEMQCQQKFTGNFSLKCTKCIRLKSISKKNYLEK